MTDFITGENRYQGTLFPESIDDYIPEENPVRVIDVFVDELNLSRLGFHTTPQETGRPAYHPAMLLKLYIYGYMNRIQSSRRLEREAQRNVELMWLTSRLAPDHKTIANFRRHYGGAIQQTCRRFVFLCRQMQLFDDAFVAIDGSKFKAVNTRDKNFTKAKMKRRLEQIDESIARYLAQMESADREATKAAKKRIGRLEDKIARLKQEMQRLQALEEQMLATPDQQISLTDPDARSMATSGRGTGMVGYNVQAAIDAKHHLIVAHEVTNAGHDRAALSMMARKAKEEMGVKKLEVVVDRGYYSGEEILSCEQSGVTTYIPRVQTSGNFKKGMYAKRDFKWMAKDREYQCPGGERLKYRFDAVEAGKTIQKYWSSNCPKCPIKSQCTTNVYRRISRWEHEEVLEVVQARMDNEPERMRVRRNTAEHPFGTLKSWMGSTHFLMRTMKHVSTEMSLHVLAYNLKRVINIMGVKPLMKAMQA